MSPPLQKPQPIDIDAIKAKIVQGQEKLDALVATVDAEYAFQALVTSHIFRLSKGYREAEHGPIPGLVELAAFHLYPRFGQGGSHDAGQIQAIINALTKQNQFRGLAAAFSVDRTDTELESLQVHLRIDAEYVRGSSYPLQTRRRIEQIHGPFDGWFRAKAGIGSMRALEVLDAFEKAGNENLNTAREKFLSIQTRMDALAKRLGKKSQTPGIAEETELERKALKEDFARFTDDLLIPLTPVTTVAVSGHGPSKFSKDVA